MFTLHLQPKDHVVGFMSLMHVHNQKKFDIVKVLRDLNIV